MIKSEQASLSVIRIAVITILAIFILSVGVLASSTGVKNVNRSDDAWAVDPLLPVEMQVDNSWHTNDGFDRGHLCASDDRVFSSEANKQTFYFSNLSPQFNSFNGGYWVTFEQLVNSWVRKDNAFGSVYDKI